MGRAAGVSDGALALRRVGDEAEGGVRAERITPEALAGVVGAFAQDQVDPVGTLDLDLTVEVPPRFVVERACEEHDRHAVRVAQGVDQLVLVVNEDHLARGTLRCVE